MKKPEAMEGKIGHRGTGGGSFKFSVLGFCFK